MLDNQQTPIETIRLGPRERHQLVRTIQQASSATLPAKERRRLRVEYHGHVVVGLKNPEAGQIRYSVIPRNLSSRGLGFIHGQYVHEDRLCEVIIPTLENEWVLVPGRIRSCRHLTRLIHDVSVVFSHDIRLEDHVLLSPDQARACRQERIDQGHGVASAAQPVQLTGQAVVLDDQPTDRQLYSVWLAKMGLSAVPLERKAQLFETLAGLRVDLIVIDQHIGGQDASAVIAELRRMHCHSAIIALSHEESDQAQATMLAAGANAVMAKPLDRESLHQVAEQLMLTQGDLADAGHVRLQSQLSGDPEMQPLIQSFVGEVRKIERLVGQARQQGDMGQLQTLCVRLKGGGASYGFASLTRMAKLALGQLHHPHGTQSLNQALDSLMLTLGRITQPD